MSKTRYNIDLVFANLFFGANFSFYVSLTRNYLDFQQIFMLQVLSAAVFFIPFALLSKQSFRIRWRDAGNILIVTMLIVYGWMYMLLWGSSYTSPIDASIISTLGPAVTLIMDHLMHPHKYIRARVVGVVCALIGAAVLLFDHGFVLTHGSRAYGNALVLVAVVAIAINTVIIKPQLERLGTLVVMGWYYIIGLAVTAPFFWKYIAHTQFLKLPLQAQAAAEPVYWNYGAFIQQCIDFTILAFCVFMMVKLMNRLMKKKEEAPAPAAEPVLSKEEQLLTEIRDLLKEQKK